MSFGTNGLLFTAGASRGRGNADGNDVAWTNADVHADGTLTLKSGGDTTLKGSTATGKQVVADVGRDLAIESLQDTSRYDSKQQNVGGSISIGYGKMGGSFSAGQSKVNSNYQSVTEQSGIQAGDGGFQVDVKGNTDLKGAVIASTDKAVQDGKNRFGTGGTLTMSDLENKADYKASSTSINVGTGVSFDGKLVPGGTGVGFGRDADSADSTTRSGISGVAGNKDVRSGNSANGIAKIFDASTVQKEIDAQTQITQMFGQQAPKAAASFAKAQGDDLKAQAKAAAEAGDKEKAQALLAEAAKWEEGGSYRVALHAVIGGFGGGTSGALGAGAAAAAAPLLNEFQQNIADSLKKAGAGDTVSKAAAQIIATGTAAAIGSVASGGTTAGAATVGIESPRLF